MTFKPSKNTVLDRLEHRRNKARRHVELVRRTRRIMSISSIERYAEKMEKVS